MLSDARKLPPDTTLSGDVCIVGAGPAGLTVARQLGAARVVLLESGGMLPDAATQELASGDVVGESYWSLDTSRLRCFGGTSQHWTGWCRPLDPLDFEARPWVEGSGWPLSRQELVPYYERAQRICDLGPFDYDAEAWAKRLGHELLPLDRTFARTCLWQLSRPTRFADKYLEEIKSSNNIDAYLHATVTSLETGRTDQRVERALAASIEGNRFRVKARVFVLAAGGLDNARLLLMSSSPPGLGNRSGLVGRYFLEHPHAVVGVLACSASEPSLRLYEAVCDVAGGAPAAVRATLTLDPELQRRERLLGSSITLEPVARPLPFQADQAQSTLSLARRLQGMDGERTFELLARTEQYPSPDSHLSLASSRDALGAPKIALDWRHHPLTRHSIRRTVELLAEALGQARVGRVYSYIHGPSAAPGTWPEIYGGFHHMGTTRMHDDPRFGVVDRDARVHSVDNLYVAGSSVFPSGGHANPTLTLVALAARLADTLRRSVL